MAHLKWQIATQNTKRLSEKGGPWPQARVPLFGHAHEENEKQLAAQVLRHVPSNPDICCG